MLAVLVAFLAAYSDDISATPLIRLIGRVHPVVLHLPIGFTAFLILYSIYGRRLDHRQVESSMIQWTIFSALVAAAVGIILASESETLSVDLERHRNFALLYCGVLIGLYFVYKYTIRSGYRIWYNLGLVLTTIFLIIASHEGAKITHGSDFLMAPLIKEEKRNIEEIYADAVVPIMESKCFNCHKPSRKKGELDLTSYDKIMEGGESGDIIQANEPEQSEFVRRLRLPHADDDHMPPQNKPQLSDHEIDLLHHWIIAGAPDNLPLSSLEVGNPMLTIISSLQEIPEDKYDFKPAKESVIKELNTPYRSVTPMYPGSPALEASLFVASTFSSDLLKELTKIKQQLVSLNISNLPVSDTDFEVIKEFQQLEELIANGTQITGSSLTNLLHNENLTSLAIASTETTITDLRPLFDHPTLKTVYAWNTNIAENDFKSLGSDLGSIHIELGYSADSEPPIALISPTLENEKVILDREENVRLACIFPGAEIRYTTDGTEPDSSSQLYQGPISISAAGHIKAKSFLNNWDPSLTAEFHVFKIGVLPEDISFIESPNTKYKGLGAETIINGSRGDITDFTSTEWLGFRESPFDIVVDFGSSPPPLTQLIICYGVNTGSYIMPPIEVKLWGGNTQNDLQLLTNLTVKQPDNHTTPGEKSVELQLDETTFQYYRLQAYPVKRLPSWHAGKGDRGWVFIDEVLFYE